MLLILLCIYFGYTNSVLARRKGLNIVPWIFATIFAYFIGIMLGCMFIAMFYKGSMDQVAITKYLYDSPSRIILVMLGGIGGCLMVRYILEKKNDINSNNTE